MTGKSSEPVRVLQIVTNMSYGGLENLLMNYYRHIDRSKVQFDFLTHVSIHQDFEEEIEQLGGRIYRLPRLNPFSFRYLKLLNEFFKSHSYRIVHSHLDCMSAVPLRLAARNGSDVRIAHGHSSNQVHNLKYPIKLLFRRLIPCCATSLFACGNEAGDWMFRGKEYSVMNNAIDAEAFRYRVDIAEDVKREFGIENCFVLGHVGQFREEKNHLFLIEVFSEIAKKDASSKLILVGKGPQMEPAKQKVNDLGIQDKVLFLGARADIARLMQAMDVFVLPSTHEGFPVTLVEAQAAGLPCIISDGVPMECRMTEDVRQIELKQSAVFWADSILKYRNYERRNQHSTIVSAGYDIQSNAKWLEEFYLNA